MPNQNTKSYLMSNFNMDNAHQKIGESVSIIASSEQFYRKKASKYRAYFSDYRYFKN